jgi:hypothetical protein
MMKPRLLLLLAGLLVACHYNYDESAEKRMLYAARQHEPSQTITVERQACTGCTETTMTAGRLLLPADLRATLHDSMHWHHDVQLTGHFPVDLLGDDSWQTLLRSPNSPPSFTITGKVVGIFNNGNLDGGAVPLFYVESW